MQMSWIWTKTLVRRDKEVMRFERSLEEDWTEFGNMTACWGEVWDSHIWVQGFWFVKTGDAASVEEMSLLVTCRVKSSNSLCPKLNLTDMENHMQRPLVVENIIVSWPEWNNSLYCQDHGCTAGFIFWEAHVTHNLLTNVHYVFCYSMRVHRFFFFLFKLSTGKKKLRVWLDEE